MAVQFAWGRTYTCVFSYRSIGCYSFGVFVGGMYNELVISFIVFLQQYKFFVQDIRSIFSRRNESPEVVTVRNFFDGYQFLVMLFDFSARRCGRRRIGRSQSSCERYRFQ